MPYVLLVPAIAAIGVGMGYPLYRLAVMSTQEFGLRQQFGTAPPESVGLDNYRELFGDAYFWEVLRRSVVFCLVNVGLTMALGTLVALLLTRLGKRMRIAVSSALLFAWAVPALTASVIWQWIFDPRYGVVNWLLTGLGGDFEGHSWLSEPLSFYFVATLIVVWMGTPFIALTVYAGMTQIPGEVMEAASIDGAGAWQRFRDVDVAQPPPAVRGAHRPQHPVGPAGLHPDLRVAAGGQHHPRDNLLGTYAYRWAVPTTSTSGPPSRSSWWG